MKRVIGIIIAIGVIIVGAVFTLTTIDINRVGKDKLYVQISEHTEVEETRLDSGRVAKRYWYELSAFDKNGQSIKVEFSAAKELQTDAYLMLYVKNTDEVTSYNEVEWDEIPIEAQEKLNE